MDNVWLVYVLFLVAGLLVGGTWSAYKAQQIVLAAALGLCAIVAFAAGCFWGFEAWNTQT